MTESDPLYPYRLALSYLERVEDEIARWAAVRSKRKIDLSRYDSIRAVYAQHVARAKETVDGHRARATADLDPMREELRLANRTQRKLLEQAAEGSLSASEANKQNKAIAATIADLEQRIETSQTIVDAQDASDVGGFISLPLDEYEAKLIPAEPLEDDATSVATTTSPVTPSTVFAVFAIALLIAFAVYGYRTFGGSAQVSFQAEAAGPEGTLIRVICRSEGNRTAQWYIPWPEGNARPPGATRSSYGVLLYAIESDSDALRLVPNSEGCWQYRGAVLMDSGPLDVRPGLAISILLDPHRLRELGVDASSVRLVFTRYGGVEVDRFEKVIE